MKRLHSSAMGAAAACAIGVVVATAWPAAQSQAPASSTATQRIRQSGAIRLGYRDSAQPFSSAAGTGKPSGYSIEVCQLIADAAMAQSGIGATSITWVPVTAESRFEAVQNGQVDLLCGAESVTLSRRMQVSFSTPIYPGGVGAVVRQDAPARLREVLEGRTQSLQPTWRASASRALTSRAFVVVRETTADRWLTERIKELGVVTTITRVATYEDAFRELQAHQADVLFGERAVLADRAQRAPAKDLLVIDRSFTAEPLALAFGRGEDELRLLIDLTLSRAYHSGRLAALYAKWFGEPDETALAFFRWSVLSHD
jgi:ABC-type amino acid transport substrate-binding protein